MPIAPSNFRGALLGLASFAVYATSDTLVKFLGASYSPFQLIFFTGLLGFPLVTVILMSDRSVGTLIPKHPYWTALRTVAAVLSGITSFYAFSVLPLAQCYAIIFAMPILITLLAIPILGERIGIHRGLAIVVGLIGVMIVLRPGDVPLELGHLSALAAAFLGATTSVIVRKIGHEERSIVLMIYPMMANFVIMAVALPFVYIPIPIEHFGMMGAMSLLGLVAGLLMIAAYRRAPAIIVAPMQYSQMIWAIFYGALFFNESIDLWTAIGAAVITAAGVYIVLREDRSGQSINRPVLETRSRLDSGTTPRISTWMRLFENRRARDKANS